MKILLTLIMAANFIFPSGQNLNTELEELSLESKNYLVYSLDAEEVIAHKNNDIHLSGASINKVLTVLTALDYIDEKEMDKAFDIDPKIFDDVASEASVAGFYPNQTVTLRDVLYGIMLPSGADAAILLSYKLFDSRDGIVDAMNKKAESLGMENTVIKNQVGLDDDGQYTTLDDLLILLLEALENDLFYEIYTSASYDLSHSDETLFDGILVQALKSDAEYIIGAKSGYTLDAGRALSSLGDNETYQYIIISTQAEGGYYEDNGALNDAIKIYSYLFDHFQEKTLIKENQEVGSLKIKYHYHEIPLRIPEVFEAFVIDSYHTDDLEIILDLNEDLKAPLEKGEVLATYKVKVQNNIYHEGEIILEEDLKADYLDQLIIIVPIIVILATIITVMIVRKRRLGNR